MEGKVSKLLKALLVIPEGELDDTHFDKLQSRLLNYCAPSSISIFLESGGLQTVKDGANSEDYRIVSVCWRLLGKLCRNEGMFDTLLQSDGKLFESLFSDASSASQDMEPLRVDSALHCLHDLAKMDTARDWLLNRSQPTVVEAIFKGMDHPSHFISRSATRLLVILIKKGGQAVVDRLEGMDLLLRLDEYLPIPRTMNKQEGENLVQKKANEEGKHHIINLMVSLIKNSNSRKFLHQQRLIWRSFPLLFDADRLIRSTFIEVLQIVSKHGFHYLMLPTGDITEDEKESSSIISRSFEQLFHSSSEEAVIFPAFAQRNPVQRKADIVTAIDLLSSIEWRTIEGQHMLASRWQEISDVMSSLLGWHHSESSRIKDMAITIKGCRSAFALAFFTFMSHHVIPQADGQKCPCDVGPWMNGLIKILKEECFEDPRVIKRILDILARASVQFCLQHYSHTDGLAFGTEEDAWETMLGLIEHTTDRAIVTAILSLLKKLLTAIPVEKQQQLLGKESFGGHLITLLQRLLFDWNWELRETAVSFLTVFFETQELMSPILREFGLKNNLHQSILTKLEDAESYVRASSLLALEGVCATQPGWDALTLLKEDFPLFITSFFVDSEAFVKREAVALTRSWLQYTYGIQCLQKLSQIETVRTKMHKIMTDFDWEVKVKGIDFFAFLWKKISTEGLSGDGIYLKIFFGLNGDVLLMEALSDYERLVRLAVAKLLQEVQQYAIGMGGYDRQNRKRKHEERDKEEKEATSHQEKEADQASKRSKLDDVVTKETEKQDIEKEKEIDKEEGKGEEREAERWTRFLGWVVGLDLGGIIAESDDVYEEDEYLIRHADVGEDAKTVLDCPF